jgi:GTPase SAR1 family protein
MLRIEESKIETIKCVCVGDEKVGKSSILKTLATGKYPVNDDDDDKEEKFSFYVDLKDNLNSNSTGLIIEFTDYDSELNLNDFNVVMICFSLENKLSFKSVEKKWMKTIESFNNKLSKNSDKYLSYFLVGLKSDLINEDTQNFQRQSPLRRSKKGKIHPNGVNDELEKYAKKIGAFEYIELSAREDFNVDFDIKLNEVLEKIYKGYYLTNLKEDKKLTNIISKLKNNSYSRLESTVLIKNVTSMKQDNLKFKFGNLFRRCKNYLFSCASSKYAGDNDIYENLDRPTDKLRNSKSKFHKRNGKKIKNAESSITLNIENDDEIINE